MENRFPEVPAENAGLLDLGLALGENVAFGLVSGQTAAARAACLHRVREQKLYQALQTTWDEFCPKYLKCSRAEADRTIRLWEEFGAGYFEMAQLTRVSAQTYRALAPAVKDGALHVDGEAIALNPENSQKVAAAVTKLRGEIRGKAEPEKKPPADKPADPIEDLRHRGMSLVREVEAIGRNERNGANWSRFSGVFKDLRMELARIAVNNNLG